MVRYYGYYSNVSRGRRKNSDHEALVPCILQPDESSKRYRKNWARLIQKIYDIDPLACPRCKGEMRIIAFIEGGEVIEKILKHLGLWELTPRPPPRMATSQPLYTEPHIDYSDSQVSPSDNGFYGDPIYPADVLA
jgi:hypothetical protein